MTFFYPVGFLIALAVETASAVNNGLARTPQMGWNNWNSFGCDVSEGLLLETAEKLNHLGLRDVGYNYVLLDDCWSGGRDKKGFLYADANKFPHGMKYVADKVHDMGMLYGMYSTAGELTCARYDGSLDHEEKDAQAFASWGVDYLKYDNCYAMGRHGSPETSYNRFKRMADAIKKTGRPMLYSLCSWGEDLVHAWGVSIANSWRMSGDIYDSFTRPDVLCSCDDPRDPLCISPGSRCSVLNILNKVAAYSDRGQPGGWNDLDMLEVGQGGMTDSEYVAHFTMWAVVKSPLIIGTDLRSISPSALTILNNPAIIAINQDPLGLPSRRVTVDYNVKKDKYGMGEAQVWSGPLANGDQLVVFLNAAAEDLEMEVGLDEVFVDEGPGGSAPQCQQTWTVHDLWSNRMSHEVAKKLIVASDNGDEKQIKKVLKDAKWYNATETSYKEGLEKLDPRLYGTVVGTVGPNGVLKASVKMHSVAAYRLRTDEQKQRYLVHNEL